MSRPVSKLSLWQGETEHVPLPARLAKIEQLTPHEKYYQVRFEQPMPVQYYPGQFVQLWVPEVGEAPISISSAPDGSDYFEMAIRKIGNVTRALHDMEEGATVGIRGPYGHGFPVEELRGSDLVLIAGGIGYAPLRSLVKYTLLHRDDFGKLTLLYGARTPQDFLFYDELVEFARDADIDVRLTIDKPAENWDGHVGVVTTLIPDLRIEVPKTHVVVCGPPVMYKFVLISLSEHRVPADRVLVSLERRMECGVGKCGHCQINNKYVCKHGPVFSYAAVKNLPEAFVSER